MQQLLISDLFKVAEVELVYKSNVDPKNRIIISEPGIAYDVLKSAWDMNKIELLEQFKILLLNHNKSCLGISEISTGGIASCVVDPKLVFATALKGRATSIILAHNHPSGNLKPSQADIDLTQTLVRGGNILGLNVVEHIILTKHGYTSFAREGYIP